MRTLLTCLLASLSLAASAAPAPWFWWVSPHDNLRICAQTSPGDDWVKSDGPYRDSHCSRR